MNDLRHAFLVLALGSLAIPMRAAAQACTVVSPAACPASTSASLTVPAVIQVTVSPTSAEPATAADFDAGYGMYGGPTISVSANTGWALSIAAAAATWSATNTVPGVAARTDKPVQDFLWSIDGTTFTSLETAATPMGTGGATTMVLFTLVYRVLYSLELDTPGTYEVTLVLTVTAP